METEPIRRRFDRPRRALALAGWIAFIVTGAIFFGLAWNFASHDTIVTIDAKVANWLHRHASPPLTALMLAITHANSTAGVGMDARARPHFDDPFLTLDTFSFPSGHTAGATVWRTT